MYINIKSNVIEIGNVENICLMCDYFKADLSDTDIVICPQCSPMCITFKKCKDIKHSLDNNK